MARVMINPFLLSFLGSVGDIVFKERYGMVYASRRPVAKRREFNAAQKAAQERFRQATRYAAKVMADPQARVPYDMAAEENETHVQNLIVADFLNAPSVDEIDLRGYDGRAGSTVRIRASDDFDVTAVTVSILETTGGPIESGVAILSAMNWGDWVYAATTSVSAGTRVRIEVTAKDRPGNTVTKSADTVV